jgi:hypothetical protein
MVKAMEAFDIRNGYLIFKNRVRIMKERNDFRMFIKHERRFLKMLRLIERDKQRKLVKEFRLNLVAGILHKFYQGWFNARRRDSFGGSIDIPESFFACCTNKNNVIS